jgi:uncharacterized membrane protein YccC
MSYVWVWFWMSVGGFIAWATDGFAPHKTDVFAGAVWFGGMALLGHWFATLVKKLMEDKQ